MELLIQPSHVQCKNVNQNAQKVYDSCPIGISVDSCPTGAP